MRKAVWILIAVFAWALPAQAQVFPPTLAPVPVDDDVSDEEVVEQLEALANGIAYWDTGKKKIVFRDEVDLGGMEASLKLYLPQFFTHDGDGGLKVREDLDLKPYLGMLKNFLRSGGMERFKKYMNEDQRDLARRLRKKSKKKQKRRRRTERRSEDEDSALAYGLQFKSDGDARGNARLIRRLKQLERRIARLEKALANGHAGETREIERRFEIEDLEELGPEFLERLEAELLRRGGDDGNVLRLKLRNRGGDGCPFCKKKRQFKKRLKKRFHRGGGHGKGHFKGHRRSGKGCPHCKGMKRGGHGKGHFKGHGRSGKGCCKGMKRGGHGKGHFKGHGRSGKGCPHCKGMKRRGHGKGHFKGHGRSDKACPHCKGKKRGGHGKGHFKGHGRRGDFGRHGDGCPFLKKLHKLRDRFRQRRGGDRRDFRRRFRRRWGDTSAQVEEARKLFGHLRKLAENDGLRDEFRDIFREFRESGGDVDHTRKEAEERLQKFLFSPEGREFQMDLMEFLSSPEGRKVTERLEKFLDSKQGKRFRKMLEDMLRPDRSRRHQNFEEEKERRSDEREPITDEKGLELY